MALKLKLFLFRSEEGQTLTEYALIILVVILAIIVALSALGTNLGNFFTRVANIFQNL